MRWRDMDRSGRTGDGERHGHRSGGGHEMERDMNRSGRT